MAVLTSALWTWSNALTTLRLIAAPFFFCALLGDGSDAFRGLVPL